MAYLHRYAPRIEYPGTIYHVTNRGDRREAIYRDDEDRATFLRTLGEACGKAGWQIHARCLMGNHFHLVLETPQANLVAGKRWLLGTFTVRFNRRHRLCAETPMARDWIAAHRGMGSASNRSAPLKPRVGDCKL